LDNLKKIFDKLGSNVVAQARVNLKKKKKGDSNLSKNLSYKVKRNSIEFTLAEYWEYVDAGVKGVGGSKASEMGVKLKSPKPWKLKKVTNNKFKYTDKKPPFMAFNGWTIRKGIAPRNKKGQLMKRKSLLYAIANSVYHTGIETTHFFTDALDNEVLKLGDEIGEAFALDLIDGMNIKSNNVTITK
tara:strand:+ start:3589 stop:4146 length:558 start_codon:yes stop_codon:yes gene_type:complete